MKHVGNFCAERFSTKAEAEKSAEAKNNYQVWHYHAKKYLPKRA